LNTVLDGRVTTRPYATSPHHSRPDRTDAVDAVISHTLLLVPGETDAPFMLRRAPSAPDLTVEDNGVTFMIVCAGGPMTMTLVRLQIELETGRQVSVIATPQAAAWFEHYEIGPTIEKMTGWRVRSELPPPTEPTFDPPGSSVLVSPCTLNTLTKWAAAHSDNLAVSLLCEAIGRGVPTRAEVSLSPPYASLPAARDALTRLSALGVDLRRAHRTAEPSFLPAVPSDVAARLEALGPTSSR
jgi:hypothetical protein